MRKTKLNELPQLWDVFRGRMSLVGPRPQMLRINALYPPSYSDVLNRVRPGITGIGSIVFRDEEKILTHAVDRDYCYTKQIVPFKAELEEWYSENRSVWLDLKIIFLTLWYVVHPRSTLIDGILPPHLVRPAQLFDGLEAPSVTAVSNQHA